MLKTSSAETSSSTNVRRFRGPGDGEMGDGDKVGEVGGNLLKEENLSKVNPSGTRFLTPEASVAFTCLRKAFIEAPIFYHFDPECHIRIETDASSFAIGRIFSQLTLGHVTHTNPDLPTSEIGQWHPVAFFSRKMIPAETRYETHDGELLAIVKAFKTWRYYLEACRYKVLILTDHNNLRRFIDTKSWSVRQIWWAQELSQYHFQINYGQGKANGAADALSRFPQRNQAKKDALRAENTWILHRLQILLTNASLSSLTADIGQTNVSPLHHVLICGTHVLPQLCKFWETLRSGLAKERPYQASIGGMRLQLPELQTQDTQAQ